MSDAHFDRRPLRCWTVHRRWRWILGATGVVLGAVAHLAVATYARAAAGGRQAAPARQVVPGQGVALPGTLGFVGYYRAFVGGRWVKVYCVDPDKRSPRTMALDTLARVPGVSADVTRQLAEVLWAHGDADRSEQAEAVSQAVNELVGNRRAVASRAGHLSRQVRDLAAQYVREARAIHGPVTLTLRLPASPLPGQSATATVTLHAGRTGLARAVNIGHSGNVNTPGTVRTNGAGTATFRYTTTGSGHVNLTASVSAPANAIRVSRNNATTQRMISWAPAATVRARGGYQGALAGFTHTYSCTDECEGHPQVTMTACAPASTYYSRITYRFAGQAHVIEFAPASQQVCTSWTALLSDGWQVTAQWQYRTPHGWTSPSAAPGGFTVDCPAAPPVAAAVSYDCAQASVTVILGHQRGGVLEPLTNNSSHPMALELGGAVTGRFELAPGATATAHTYSVPCGTGAAITVQSSVQRSSGDFNRGRPMQLRVP